MALRKVIVPYPGDIKKQKTSGSYSSDIKFVNNYLIHKVDKIEPSPIKYLFIDIEVLSPKEFPEPAQAKYPISAITIYNSESKEYITWWLPDYKNEKSMLDDFCFYVHGEAPDLFLAWNVKFDYDYLHNRITDFPKRISPVGLSRFGGGDSILYPAGISIVDYLGLYKKVFMKEPSYALDFIAQHRLKEKPWPKTDFGEMSQLVKDKNINDVVRMVKIEENEKLLPYYDEIRRLTKVNWEDLYFNSRIIEQLLLEEAKLKNIILPDKKENSDDKGFKGAIRDTEVTGAHFNIGKSDLTSAYPSMITNFCLDPQNVDPGETDDNIEIDGIYFSQNKDALVPSMVKKILVLKDNIKKEKAKDPSLITKYNAIKGIVNSAFGVFGNKYFRLFDNRITSAITYLVRDLIKYTQKRLKEENIDVLYYDTDSIFTSVKGDITSQLNQYIQDWGKQYGKTEIKLKYEYEGYFDSIFLLAKCHYFGYVHGKEKPEIKGVEIIRMSSSKYEAYFQQELLERILKKHTKDEILDWIATEKDRIKTLPVEQVGFPVKIHKNKKYVNTPIFVRAYELTKTINPKFSVNSGELFYYVFVKPITRDDNVLAFKMEDKDFIDWDKHLDWGAIIQRNIIKKSETIFEAQGWETNRLRNSDQMGLF